MFRLLTTALLFTAAHHLSALAIVDAYPRHMDEEQFKTVTEYLTGEARDGPRVVVRSRPDERSGQYFILTLNQKARELPQGSEVVLEVLKSNARDPEIFAYPLPPSGSGSRQIFVGVTGQDWSDRSLQPLAWRVEVRHGERVLGEWKSFLWELP